PETYKKAGRQVLTGLIDSKRIYVDALSEIPSADLPAMRTRVDEYFDKDQLPELLKRYEARDREQLEKKLQETGDSLADVRERFFESVVVGQWHKEMTKATTSDSADTPAARRERAEKYIAGLRERTKVWTIYDADAAPEKAKAEGYKDFDIDIVVNRK